MKILISIISVLSIILGTSPLRAGIDTFNLYQIREAVMETAKSMIESETTPITIEEELPLSETADNIETHIVTFLDWEGNCDFSLEVEHGKSIENIPESDWEEGIFDYWSRTDNGEKLRTDTPIYEDVTYEPNYIYLEWFVLNSLAFGNSEINDCNPDNIREIAQYIRDNQ